MAWMIIRVIDETGQKNIIKNGDGLSDTAAESRFEALQKRCPAGQRFEKISYDPKDRDMVVAEQQIIEYSEFV